MIVLFFKRITNAYTHSSRIANSAELGRQIRLNGDKDRLLIDKGALLENKRPLFDNKCHLLRNTWHLFTGDDLLDVVEFVEGFEGGEVVDVEAQDFIADLAEDGVIELEEGELHAFAGSGDFGSGFANGANGSIFGFELL